MQFRKPIDFAEGLAKYFGAEARSTHSQEHDVRKGRGLNLFGELHKTRSCFLLLANDAPPAKPLVFIGAGPQRRIARPHLANLSARDPFLERRVDTYQCVSLQRSCLWIDCGRA